MPKIKSIVHIYGIVHMWISWCKNIHSIIFYFLKLSSLFSASMQLIMQSCLGIVGVFVPELHGFLSQH